MKALPSHNSPVNASVSTGSKLAQPLDLRNPANLLAYLSGQHVSTFPRVALPR